MTRLVAWALIATSAATAAPADRLPEPRREACIPFDADPGENEIAAPSGLSYSEVKAALGAVIQTALYCGRPDGFSEVHLTFDLVVGCDGLVRSIETADGGGAPAYYVACVSDVVRKADFPPHDIADGMLVTYPVDVTW